MANHEVNFFPNDYAEHYEIADDLDFANLTKGRAVGWIETTLTIPFSKGGVTLYFRDFPIRGVALSRHLRSDHPNFEAESVWLEVDAPDEYINQERQKMLAQWETSPISNKKPRRFPQKAYFKMPLDDTGPLKVFASSLWSEAASPKLFEPQFEEVKKMWGMPTLHCNI